MAQHSAIRPGLLAVWVALVTAGSACSLLVGPNRDYLSNTSLMQTAATGAGYDVDPSTFKLSGVDLRDDAVTLQYEGVAHPGDQAWVVRFSEKSTEREPGAIADVWSIVDVLAEGRAGFEVIEDGTRPIGDAAAQFVRYRFHSPVRDDAGEPFVGHGLVAVVRLSTESGPLVHHVKLDNYGDRDELTWDDLAPLVAPIASPAG